MEIKEKILTWYNIMKKGKYLFLTLVLTIVFYLINIFFSNFKYLKIVFNDAGMVKLLEALIFDSLNYYSFFTYPFFIGLIIISLLFGTLISLITYKTKMLKDVSGRRGFLISAGIFLGIIAPGCSACGIGFLSTIGIGASAILFLPWKGLELIIISIITLFFANYKILGDIKKGIVCEISQIKKE